MIVYFLVMKSKRCITALTQEFYFLLRNVFPRFFPCSAEIWSKHGSQKQRSITST